METNRTGQLLCMTDAQFKKTLNVVFKDKKYIPHGSEDYQYWNNIFQLRHRNKIIMREVIV